MHQVPCTRLIILLQRFLTLTDHCFLNSSKINTQECSGSTLIIYCEPLSFLFCMQIKVASFCMVILYSFDFYLNAIALDLQGTECNEKKIHFLFSTLRGNGFIIKDIA